MTDDADFVLNLVLPADLSRELQRVPHDGFRVEDVSTQDQDVPLRFGVADVATVIGVVKGVLEAVKLGAEILRMLKERTSTKHNGGESASLSTPDGRTCVIITADMQTSEVESEIRQAFAPAR